MGPGVGTDVGAVVVPQTLLIQSLLEQSDPALQAESSAHGGHSPPPQSVSVSLPSLFPLVQVATEGVGVGRGLGARLILGRRLGDGLGTSVGVADGGRDASVTVAESMVEYSQRLSLSLSS